MYLSGLKVPYFQYTSSVSIKSYFHGHDIPPRKRRAVTIVLTMMHQLGAVIKRALAIAMVPQGGLAMTAIMMTTMTKMTMTTAGSVVGSAAGEQRGRAGARGVCHICAQIKEGQ
jgi:hypothetical protein